MQKENRLTRRVDFNKVYRYGKSAANHQFVVYVMNRHSASAGDGFRLGISVSKKVGNAVVRNRLRRRIKDVDSSFAEAVALGARCFFVVRVR